MPIRPGLDPKWLGIKTTVSKKYRKFEKNYYGQISITGPDLDPQKIENLTPGLVFYKKALNTLFLNRFSI